LLIGVLALQGDFREHIWALQRLGVEAFAVKSLSELEKVDGLIIPVVNRRASAGSHR